MNPSLQLSAKTSLQRAIADGGLNARGAEEKQEEGLGEDSSSEVTQTLVRTVTKKTGKTDFEVTALAQQTAAAVENTNARINDIAVAAKNEFDLTKMTQEELRVQQQAVIEKLMEQQAQLQQQYEILAAASDTVASQGLQIQALKGAVEASRSSRWGCFADVTMESPRVGPTLNPGVLVAPGKGVNKIPTYSGKTKKEKREFMDAYLDYMRQVESMNQGAHSQMYLLPVGDCIEHSTKVRICLYELFKPVESVTEQEWKAYFLEAHDPEPGDFVRFQKAMKTLAMDTELQDAGSRITKLLADFHSIVEENNMESLPQLDPKATVRYLVNAFRPKALKDKINVELKKPLNKPYGKSLQGFLQWVKPIVARYLEFEAFITPDSKETPSTTRTGKKKGKGKNAGKPEEEKTENKNESGGKKNPSMGDRKCLACSSTAHGVFQCDKVTLEEAKKLLQDFKDKKKSGTKLANGAVKKVETTAVAAADSVQKDTAASNATVPCVVNGRAEARVVPDSGADLTVVSPSFVKKLRDAGDWLQTRKKANPLEISGFGAEIMNIEEEVKLELMFQTPEGPLTLRNVLCGVAKVDLPYGLGDILLSRAVMCRLGYHPLKWLEQARQQSDLYDLEDVHTSGSAVGRVMLAAEQRAAPITTPEEENFRGEEEGAWFPFVEAKIKQLEDLEETKKALSDGVMAAIDEQCSQMYQEGLAETVIRFEDVFRTKLGRDPPVDMPPLKVTLKKDAKPVKCKARRYPVAHRDFLKKHVEKLVEHGLVYRNPNSKWCSPPLIVNKPGVNQFRMTVDVRGVNGQTISIAWPMPMLDVIMEKLKGAKYFFSLDFFKGYWQFKLHAESQELFSFLTDEGVFTPTRVLMGATDSVAYCQATVQEMFKEFLYNGLLIWLDDLLGYSDTEEGLLKLLNKVLKRCEELGLKLNPKKCVFFTREIKWCGRVVSGEGVRHDPERIVALLNLPLPNTGQDLQQFICALNWMRMSIPGYNKLTHPLNQLMEEVYKKAGGRTKRHASKVALSEVGWNEEHVCCWENTKRALANVVQLMHPDLNQKLCVFADASESHWGAVVTQVPHDQLNREFEEQHHQPLMFLSGTFSGAASSWKIIEKEAFAIVQTLKRADYMLHRPGGFLLFTDHRNLRYIFNPSSVQAAVPKYTADKLQRWALLLMAYQYEIRDISGEANVWADLLSRWGHSGRAICAIRQVPMEYSPMLNANFVWPTTQEVQQVQQEHAASRPSDTSEDTNGLWSNSANQIWIPEEAANLQLRLCVVAHFGVGGHRGIKPTHDALSSRFYWQQLRQDVEFFIQRCLHCCSTTGGLPAPRPLGEALHAEKPNELLHWDFLYMGPSEQGEENVLVIKDDASKFVWLFPTKTTTANDTLNCLLEWFAVFGVSKNWVTDQGTHFKNEVIKGVQHAMGAHHHFTTARCPWANGTVEVVNREVLRCVRALLSEWVIKLVQMVLNHTPSPSLGGVAPVTAMMGLPPISPLDNVMTPENVQEATLEEIQTAQKQHIEDLQQALDKMHKAMSEENEKKRSKAREQHGKQSQMAQFDIGDYVLYADVWSTTRSKLKVRWSGPAQVTATVSNWIFEIRNLITGDTREVHASRLKFYCDSSLNITEELLKHIAHNSEGHVVEKLLDVRYHKQERRYEILVKWRGLDERENSWEPVVNLFQDVPAVIKTFLRAQRKRPVVKALISELGISLGESSRGEGSVVRGTS